LFVLGANGTGKSSLTQRLISRVANNKRWISAHRQNWFASKAISLSPQQKRQAEQNIRVYDTQSDARWTDHVPAQRANIAIYELVDAENVDGRAIARAVRAGDLEQIEKLKKIDPPVEIINELLKASNLPIELSIDVDQQVVASKCASAPYSVAHLSDGECDRPEAVILLVLRDPPRDIQPPRWR
jgi:ABC-type ATPase involved in cell division